MEGADAWFLCLMSESRTSAVFESSCQPRDTERRCTSREAIQSIASRGILQFKRAAGMSQPMQRIES